MSKEISSGEKMLEKKRLEKKCICSNLLDAGCSKELEQTFFELEEKKQYVQQIELLRKKRCGLLEKIHIYQKKLDNLDYLIFLLEKRKKEMEENERKEK